MDLALKSAQIVDLCGKLSGFADFENTADRGSAVILGADSRLCLSYVRTLGPKRNLDHKSFFSLDRYVKGSSKFFIFWTCTVLLSSSTLPSLLFWQNKQWYSHVPVYL